MVLRATEVHARESVANDAYTPLLLRPEAQPDWDALAALRASGDVLFVHDTVRAQLAEPSRRACPIAS